MRLPVGDAWREPVRQSDRFWRAAAGASSWTRSGDAAVIRNAGGRVTQAVIDELALITFLSETKLKPEGPLFEVAVIHHRGP
ncbi:hypothetical protein D7Y13_21650 [Corallococcus praedator]|uniref:Uncharacterized protein n=1 Tax=Corallococcus praedator TaxID=2316724 RepID=A0ABX9QEG5_9BACT|nr:MULTISPECIES: hypothetical protein [Corallococcus]RKH26211.1 hypothetical protein D7X75_28745 [Corallococcus sp. CA031C]RKI05802.1 hypothetical protein D7Y13_21650 [Corallococcus praedator]